MIDGVAISGHRSTAQSVPCRPRRIESSLHHRLNSPAFPGGPALYQRSRCTSMTLIQSAWPCSRMQTSGCAVKKYQRRMKTIDVIAPNMSCRGSRTGEKSEAGYYPRESHPPRGLGGTPAGEREPIAQTSREVIPSHVEELGMTTGTTFSSALAPLWCRNTNDSKPDRRGVTESPRLVTGGPLGLPPQNHIRWTHAAWPVFAGISTAKITWQR